MLQRAADAAVPATLQIANPRVVARLQLNVSDTQLVHTSAGPVWVVPGAKGACILAGQMTATAAPVLGENSTGCGLAAGILSGGMVVGGGDGSGASRIFGLVPNGTTHVTLTSATGRQQEIPVLSNVFLATMPTSAAVTVTFQNASGRTVSARRLGFTGLRAGFRR